MNYVHSPVVLSKIFDKPILGIATWNLRGKIKSEIPREKNYVSWFVKNGKTVFSKLTRKISLSISGEQIGQHSASSFPFSGFYIFSSLLGCYFSRTSCACHFGEMFNGFLTSTFDFYWSLALHLSCFPVRLSEGIYLFPVASD